MYYGIDKAFAKAGLTPVCSIWKRGLAEWRGTFYRLHGLGHKEATLMLVLCKKTSKQQSINSSESIHPGSVEWKVVELTSVWSSKIIRITVWSLTSIFTVILQFIHNNILIHLNKIFRYTVNLQVPFQSLIPPKHISWQIIKTPQ